MNNVGKMHQAKKYYWFVFPSKETAHDGGGGALASGVERTATLLASRLAFWSKQLNCNVSYISPNDLVLLLEVDEIYKKILTSNGEMGWILCVASYYNCFEEVSQ